MSSIEFLLDRELEVEKAEEAQRLARRKHAEEVFSNISDEQSAIAHSQNLSRKALDSLLENPEMYRKYVELIKQNG